MRDQLGIDPSECIVLEDSESGVRAAKSAGCKVIAVPTKWTASQNFEMADVVLSRPSSEEIIGNIEKLMQEN